ncbi:MAG: dTDP-4-dehydrorhamnose reductase [Pseudomonadota bacterium]
MQFGATGQVGTALLRAAGERDVLIEALSRRAVDLRDAKAISDTIHDARADVVVNAAAFTGVDLAEEQEADALAVNGAAPGAMAAACATKGAPLIHLSTDYVFDGASDTPYLETDAPNPINAYGRTKLAGEVAVAEAFQSAGPLSYAVLRTSWVYSPYGRNFVKTMLRLGREKGGVRVVDDQRGAPTSAGDIASAVLAVAEKLVGDDGARAGVYHYTSSGEISWADFAAAIFEEAGVAASVERIPTTEYPTPAPRPLRSSLNCEKIENVFGVCPKPWRDGLTPVIAALREDEGA